MDKRLTWISGVVLSLFFVGTAMAQDYKIGYISTEKLFREAAPAKKAQQKLEKEFSPRDTELQKLSKKVEALQAELDKNAATMSESARRDKERELTSESLDFERRKRVFAEDLNLRRNEEMMRLQELTNKVIQEIAEAEKYDLILQEPVVYAGKRIDITDQVVKALADK